MKHKYHIYSNAGKHFFNELMHCEDESSLREIDGTIEDLMFDHIAFCNEEYVELRGMIREVQKKFTTKE